MRATKLWFYAKTEICNRWGREVQNGFHNFVRSEIWMQRTSNLWKYNMFSSREAELHTGCGREVNIGFRNFVKKWIMDATLESTFVKNKIMISFILRKQNEITSNAKEKCRMDVHAFVRIFRFRQETKYDNLWLQIKCNFWFYAKNRKPHLMRISYTEWISQVHQTLYMLIQNALNCSERKTRITWRNNR